MLKLENVCKSYTTGGFTQTALDNVSISFRDNEFVAILGPSGSGKTTMLNIIGGLDHYDSGDLIIDGISTKQYKDRDWDAYRNNRIGFVFQSYNLIPHQTVLSNVELALTLSGVSREERHKRAVEALEKVGLGDHINKKPSQLSGGQMQRVAIARALINDPEILLADEPTGALDSKTSVQIMDLLTEIAEDRLVIMVTHNPELAEEYATRIVNLSDGVVTSDTMPFNPTVDEMRISAKPTRRTSMSLLTALSLSFNNLMTKKGRTIMTAFAGSIGIIGIAAILALANGVNDYIHNVEEETLSEYPLSITSSAFDMTSMLVGAEGLEDDEEEDASTSEETDTDGKAFADEAEAEPERGDIRVIPMINATFASIGQNDLASLKEYLDSGESGIEEYVNTIEYSYNVTPQIFSSNTENLRQVNPDSSMKALGLGSGNSTNSMMSMMMSTDVFYEMPRNPDLYSTQYDVVAGHWPENHNECVLTLTAGGGISDFMLYTLGLRDYEELDEMVKKFAAEEDVAFEIDVFDYDYEDVLGITFKLVNAHEFYAFDDEYDIWVDKRDNDSYMKKLVKNGEDITIVGIVKPREDATAAMLLPGINYPASLTDHIIEEAESSKIVQDQLADPEINVFTGEEFGAEEESDFSMDSMFSIDTGAIESAFQIDASKLAIDMSGLDMSLDPSDLPELPAFTMPGTGGTDPGVTPDPGTGEGEGTEGGVVPGEGEGEGSEGTGTEGEGSEGSGAEGEGEGTGTEGEGSDSEGEGEGSEGGVVPGEGEGEGTDTPIPGPGGSTDINITEQQAMLLVQALIGDYYTNYASSMTFDAYMQGPGMAVIAQMLEGIIGATTGALTNAFATYLETAIGDYLMQVVAAIEAQTTMAMQLAMTQLTTNMASAFSIDGDAFANAFQFNLDEEELGEIIMAMMTNAETTYDSNLSDLGYADKAKPFQIDIYPIDFECKERVLEILDGYNARMDEAGETEKVVSYTDLVGTLMESVTDIIDMISYVLIAFVAISLIVSSIMIGVITYISVLERKKEIGILRAIGASKKDISHVFNAETVIEGLVSGLLGVGITALCCIPANAIIYSSFDVKNLASLPIEAACVLVVISVFLTFIAGLMPASSASRKDPVEALRSE